MADRLLVDRRLDDAAFDIAVILVDQLQALAGLLSLEKVAEQFTGLDPVEQVSIFALFEAILSDVGAALARAAHNESRTISCGLFSLLHIHPTIDRTSLIYF